MIAQTLVRDKRCKYPWHKWFAKNRFTLVRGKDYTCPQSVMIQQVRNRASRYGLGVKVRECANSFTVTLTSEPRHCHDNEEVRITYRPCSLYGD